VQPLILPKERDSRFITVRRGGSLTDSDHQLLALWAAACAEHVLHLFEAVRPGDLRPRHAIDQTRAWVRGEITMSEARAMPPMPQVRLPLSPTSPHTNSVRLPTRSRLHVLLHLKARANRLTGSSAGGSVNSSQMRFVNWSSMISGCATRSAGRCSTADGRDGVSARPTKRCEPTPHAR
jgi:hypothetical protein